MYGELTARDTVVVAVAQEDEDLESHARLFKGLDRPLPFQVVADLGRAATTRYDRTTAYLIDREGVVRQVFPMLIHFRPTWKAILTEVEELAKPAADDDR